MKNRFPISSINATILIFAIFAFCVSIFSSQIYAQGESESAQLFHKNCERLHQAYGSGSILDGEYWFTTEEGERSPLFEGVIAYCKLFVGYQVSEIVDDVTIDVYDAELNVYERDAQAEQYVAGFGISGRFRADKVPVEFYGEPHGKQIQQATLIRQNGRCTVSMFGSAKVNELWKEYHKEDTGGPGTAEDLYLPEKESTIIDLHPGFNHDQEARLKEIMQSIGADMLNSPLCGGEHVEQQITTLPAENMRETELEAVEALVETTPREDDFLPGPSEEEVIPEELRKIYIPLPYYKATAFVSHPLSITFVNVEGRPEIYFPDGRVVVPQKGDKLEIPLNTRIVTGLRTRIQINGFAFLEQSSEMRFEPFVPPKAPEGSSPLAAWVIYRGSGRFKSVVRLMPASATGVMLGARGTDFGLGVIPESQTTIVEIYDAEVEVIAPDGNSKVIKSAYDSEIQRVEISSDYQLTEKIAIPSSEWESYVLSRSEAYESQSNRGNSSLFLVIILVIIVVGAGYFIYIRKSHAQK
ncbi:hypothetical protein HY637_05330 [Candidatus Woesearchaeota archaeon]|nr:hypothetical protein [Candidatus Woesearchaeota archaeon]